MKKALITGITGQDGSYLAEHLLANGYEVHGLVRRVALEDPEHRYHRIGHLRDQLVLHPASLESYPSLFNVVSRHEFDECYHLAAQSFVAESFADGFSTMNSNINGTHYMLAAIRELRPSCRFYFAGSSEMFGKVRGMPQNEDTSGILFNHESPRRGFEFVTRKITSTAARIKLGLASELRLGNLDARRDWGHSKDYVQAMYAMLQQDEPDDYVVATGETHSVREFCDLVFTELGLDYQQYVKVDERFYRPAEVDLLIGDASKAREKLGWKPEHTFKDMVLEMVRADLEIAERRARAGG
jgi:GDPmannose 4,6-dehydratase